MTPARAPFVSGNTGRSRRISGPKPGDQACGTTRPVADEREGRPVGFSGVLDGTLEMLFVEPTQRGSGIGTALLAHAVDAPS